MSVSVKVSQLDSAAESLEKKLAGYRLEPKSRYLCTLLFDEVSNVLSSRLDADTSVLIATRRSRNAVSISLTMKAESNVLTDDIPGYDSEDREIEQKIRNTVLEKNSENIKSNYNAKKKRLKITITVPLKPRRDYEQELETFYENQKGKNITGTKSVMFLVKQRFWKFFVSFLIKIGRSAPMVVIPIISANIIDLVSSGVFSDKMWEFFLNIGIGLFSLLLNVLFAWLDSIYFKNLCYSIGQNLRNVMVRKLQLLSIAYHNENRVGAITNKMLNNVEAIEVAFATMGTHVVTIITYVTAAIVITMIKAPIMALFYTFFIPMAVFLGVVFRKPITKKNREFRKSMEGANAAVTEMLGMVETTRAHGLQKDEISRMSRYMEDLRNAGASLDVVNQVFGAISWVILQAFQIFALAFSAYIASKGIISIGMIALFQSYFSATITRISTFINAIPQCTKGFDACASIAEILCADSDEKGGTKSPETFNGDISFKGVDFRYEENGPRILDNFSLDIPSGQSVALVGESGSGKSTLINLIIGFIMPTKGTVTIDGVATDAMNLTRFRKHLAVVTQNTVLFTGTLYQNLVYGSPYVSRTTVEKVIEEVGLTDLVEALPNGLDSFISESGANLSGGQRQRISIARALLRDPAIMILDEPTSALDAENEQRIKEVLKTIQGRCTIIMIAHRLTMVENFDNVVVLQGGKIAEQGTYKALLAKKGAFAKLNSKADQTQ